ncbi:unnamed protein product [Ilex paraguariensis]|uniref:F-box domain-containing protein n=1 Tax=Ilex paraguariensis TaxID=185542 RepID=A0ABC8UB55_9AQUA
MVMDSILCDELLQEIFHRLPPRGFSAVSLVSKRWLRLLRSSTTSLSLRFTPHHSPTVLSFSSFLSHHPFLSSLSVTSVAGCGDTSNFSDEFLLFIASSCPKLRTLRFLIGPLSLLSLRSLSSSCLCLSSLTITLSRPLSFNWLIHFLSLKDLSIFFTATTPEFNPIEQYREGFENFDAELGIECLCLSGIRGYDCVLNWLWDRCKKLKKLQLKSCEGIGSFSSFAKCLKCLQEVELRSCRTIVDGVLLKLAENSESLDSLLVYDGGSREGLLQFITQTRCNLQKLDLRLPLDLDNNHLMAMAENFRGLLSIRLQSCCLVTGEGLKTLGRALSDSLEELALINCDVVEREPGLLTTLGQNLRQLRKLDLSYNELLVDKELNSMLVSCNHLGELKLRGCEGLTNAAMVSVSKYCKQLQCLDIMHCVGIEVDAVEFLVRILQC